MTPNKVRALALLFVIVGLIVVGLGAAFNDAQGSPHAIAMTLTANRDGGHWCC